jgi:hypothetical protein
MLLLRESSFQPTNSTALFVATPPCHYCGAVAARPLLQVPRAVLVARAGRGAPAVGRTERAAALLSLQQARSAAAAPQQVLQVLLHVQF